MGKFLHARISCFFSCLHTFLFKGSTLWNSSPIFILSDDDDNNLDDTVLIPSLTLPFNLIYPRCLFWDTYCVMLFIFFVSIQFYPFYWNFWKAVIFIKNSSLISKSAFDKWLLTSVLTDLLISMQNTIMLKTKYAKMLTYCKIRKCATLPFHRDFSKIAP